MPIAAANTSASDTPRLLIATAIWFASLQAWPAPCPPMWTIVLPSASNSGRARSTSASSPPIMIERRASIAPSWPPDTGASRVVKPFSFARSANARDATGEMLLMSMTRSPGCAPAAMPSGPNVTVSTSGAFVTIVTTMSERSATSRGVLATVAPSAFSASAFASVRFVTVTGNPALSAFRAIGSPMIPRPTKPMRCLVLSVAIRLRPVSLDVHGSYALVGRDEEGVLLGLADLHRDEQPLVGDVDEPARTLELVRDGLGERWLLEAVHDEQARLLDDPEEVLGREPVLVREQDRRPELFVAFVDLVEVHGGARSIGRRALNLSFHDDGTVPHGDRHARDGRARAVLHPHHRAQARLDRLAERRGRRGPARARERAGVPEARAARQDPGLPPGQGATPALRADLRRRAPLGRRRGGRGRRDVQGDRRSREHRLARPA